MTIFAQKRASLFRDLLWPATAIQTHEKRRPRRSALACVRLYESNEGRSFSRSQSTDTDGMAVGYVRREKTLFLVVDDSLFDDG